MNEPEQQPENANEATLSDLADLGAQNAEEIKGGQGPTIILQRLANPHLPFEQS